MISKRILASICTILICFSMFMCCYCKSAALITYADNTDAPLGYTQATTRKQLTDAFLAYCKTRDSELTSSVLGASATFAYNVIENATQALGINIDDIQADLYYYQTENSGFRWFMNSVGINAFNQIFAYLIQQKGLSVGDENVNELVQSGEYFIDTNGNGCFIYQSTSSSSQNSSVVTAYGTPYRWKYEAFSGANKKNIGYSQYYTVSSSKFEDFSYQIAVFARTNSLYPYAVGLCGSNVTNPATQAPVTVFYQETSDTRSYYRGQVIIFRVNSGNYYLGCIVNGGADQNTNYFLFRNVIALTLKQNQTIDNANVYFISNKITNIYEGDTVFNDNGDILDDPNAPDPEPEPEPGTPGGGTINGGGDYGDDININFPDIDFNIPDINFSLGDLSNKFPFSIPHDYAHFVSIFDKAPVAPAVTGDIPLGSFYTWHFNADFAQFDNWASLFRNVELASFCFGLIFLTIKFVKG